MQIVLKQVVPRHIRNTGASEIWNQQVTIDKGAHLHVIAPSGSGKSTLIHFIYGLRHDYDGAILVNGSPVREMTAESLATIRQKHLSIIFQDLRLFGGQTVFENIEIKRQLAPFYERAEIGRMAERLGIGDKLDQKAEICSYGEQQRIAIIRALMQPFDFLLLDEPYSHLDEVNRQKAMTLIYEECEKRGAAMIFADLKQLDFLKQEKALYL